MFPDRHGGNDVSSPRVEAETDRVLRLKIAPPPTVISDVRTAIKRGKLGPVGVESTGISASAPVRISGPARRGDPETERAAAPAARRKRPARAKRPALAGTRRFPAGRLLAVRIPSVS